MKHLQSFDNWETLLEKVLPPKGPDILLPGPKAKQTVVSQTNKEILNKINELDLNLPDNLMNTDKKEWLPKTSSFLQKNGIELELQIKTGQGQKIEDVLLPTMHLKIGKDKFVNINTDYFGLEFSALGARFGINYRYDDLPNIRGGTRERPGARSIPNTKIQASIVIPIGR